MKLPKLSQAVNQRSPYRVHIPGLISDEEIGLGNVIKRATSYMGLRPCGGCENRAATLNRWIVFSGGNK